MNMTLIRDDTGRLRPDLDMREVPGSLMAEYLGIGRATLYRHAEAGLYRKGMRKIGVRRLYRPAVIVGAA